MGIGERIKKLRIERGLTQGELGDGVGATKQTIYKYESGIISNIPSDRLELLSIVLHTTPAYLMGWEDKSNKSAKSVKIPVLNRVSAGIPIEAIEEIINYEEIPEEMAKTGDFFGLIIKGESMEPKMSDGDVVIIRRQGDIESGQVGVVIVDDTDATVIRVIKESNGIMLVATNQTAYPPKFFDSKQVEDLPVVIIGKVAELRAKF